MAPQNPTPPPSAEPDLDLIARGVQALCKSVSLVARVLDLVAKVRELSAALQAVTEERDRERVARVVSERCARMYADKLDEARAALAGVRERLLAPETIAAIAPRLFGLLRKHSVSLGGDPYVDMDGVLRDALTATCDAALGPVAAETPKGDPGHGE